MKTVPSPAGERRRDTECLYVSGVTVSGVDLKPLTERGSDRDSDCPRQTAAFPAPASDDLGAIELLLRFAVSGPDVRRTAALLIERFGSLDSVLSAAPEELSRSEEHTSELQSQFHLVCRLLL